MEPVAVGYRSLIAHLGGGHGGGKGVFGGFKGFGDRILLPPLHACILAHRRVVQVLTDAFRAEYAGHHERVAYWSKGGMSANVTEEQLRAETSAIEDEDQSCIRHVAKLQSRSGHSTIASVNI